MTSVYNEASGDGLTRLEISYKAKTQETVKLFFHSFFLEQAKADID